MYKEEIICKMEEAISNPIQWRNSMWCLESFYNPYYLVKKYIDEKKIDIDILTERELQCMIWIAEFASDVFY